MHTLRGRIAAILIGLATAIVIIAIAILPFLTPQWVAFEQERSQATAWTGFTTAQLRTATDAILADLVFGGDFAVQVDGAPVLNERERAHMADVRTVFRGLWVLAIASVVVLVIASRRRDRSATWRAVRGGALGLTVGVVDPRARSRWSRSTSCSRRSTRSSSRRARSCSIRERTGWSSSSRSSSGRRRRIVVGIVIIAIALGVAWFAGRRAARAVAAATAAAPDLAAAPAPGR